MKYVLVLGFALAGCIGYGESISPVDAQRMERTQCDAKPTDYERWSCNRGVDRKYGRYNSEGNYPDKSRIPDPSRGQR